MHNSSVKTPVGRQQPSPVVPLHSVVAAFVGRDALSNADLYDQLSLDLGLEPIFAASKAPVGKTQKPHNLYHRKVRWHQMTLRRMGILERMDRGKWRLTDKARTELTPAPVKQVLIAFSTDLDMGIDTFKV